MSGMAWNGGTKNGRTGKGRGMREIDLSLRYRRHSLPSRDAVRRDADPLDPDEVKCRNCGFISKSNVSRCPKCELRP